MEKTDSKRIPFKSLVSSQDARVDMLQKSTTKNTQKRCADEIKQLVVEQPSIYRGESAQDTAIRLVDSLSHITQNQELLELGFKYHSSSLYAKLVDMKSFFGGVFGNQQQPPSLPHLLDMQDTALIGYSRALTNVTSLLQNQYAKVAEQVDAMEKKVGLLSDASFEHETTLLQEQLDNADSHREKRVFIEKLYAHDRLLNAHRTTTDFYKQYLGQESVLRDVVHSLQLLDDKTRVFQTYISQSKGLFVSIGTVGDALLYMSPMMDKMRSQTNSLENHTHQIAGYLRVGSEQRLFQNGGDTNNIEINSRLL